MRAEGSDLDLLGFDDRELQQLLDSLAHQGGLTDPDDVPPLPEEPVTQLGDLWLLDDHRVLCGDATDPHDVTLVMNGEKAKLLATDPPYLVNYTGGNHPPSKSNRPQTREKDWDAYKDPESAVGFEFPAEECECDRRVGEPHEEGCPTEDDSVPDGCAANDVFIVEGDQERYGNKAAWEVCRRY